MYSVVLMMAVAAGGDAIDCHGRGDGCTGGGCYGSGGYGGGCWGAGCRGGYSGGCWGGECRGGYYGGGCYGGGWYGGSTLGGCTGGSSYGAVSPYGVRSMYYDPAPSGVIVQSEPIGKPKDGGKEDRKDESAPPENKKTDRPSPEASAAGRATIVVTLPADAKLTINGLSLPSGSAERRFVTLPVPAGQEVRYVVRAELMRAGQVRTIGQEVAVRAGEESRAALDLKDFTVAAK